MRLPPVVWLLLALAHALALAWALRPGGHYRFPDTDRYEQAARNIRQHGQLYARPWPPALGSAAGQEFTMRPPGYPLALLALGGRPTLVLLAQNLLSLAGLALVLGGWAARRARPPGPGAWAAALALALSFPAQLIYANALMSELLTQALVLAGVGAGLAFGRTGRARYLAGAGLALAAAALTKPVWSPAVGLLGLLGLGLAWRARRPALLTAGGLPAALLLAYAGWNGQRTGTVHFSSISTINLLHYNAYGLLQATQGPARAEAWLDSTLRRADAQPTLAARQRVMQAAGWGALRRYPLRYAGQHLAGMVSFFLDPGRFDLSQFFGPTAAGGGGLAALRAGGLAGLAGALARQPPALLLALALTWLANALRLGLAARGLRRALGPGAAPAARRAALLAAAALLYVAALTGPLGAARFGVPVWPLLLALALHGLPARGPSLRA